MEQTNEAARGERSHVMSARRASPEYKQCLKLAQFYVQRLTDLKVNTGSIVPSELAYVILARHCGTEPLNLDVMEAIVTARVSRWHSDVVHDISGIVRASNEGAASAHSRTFSCRFAAAEIALKKDAALKSLCAEAEQNLDKAKTRVENAVLGVARDANELYSDDIDSEEPNASAKELRRFVKEKLREGMEEWKAAGQAFAEAQREHARLTAQYALTLRA